MAKRKESLRSDANIEEQEGVEFEVEESSSDEVQ